MNNSALVGQPPANDFDTAYVRWYISYNLKSPLPPNQINASKGIVLVPRPTSGPNLDGEHRGPILVSVNAAAIALVFFTTAVRLAIQTFRGGLLRRWTSDDICIFFAMVFSIPMYAFQIQQVVRGGMGRHTWVLTYAQRTFIDEIFPACNVLFYMSSGFVKASIICFMSRKLNDHVRWIRWAAWIYNTILTIFTIANTFFAIFRCGDPRFRTNHFWAAQQAKPVRCMNTIPAIDVIQLTLELLLLSIGIALFLQVKTRIIQKLSLVALIAVGATSCVFAALRYVYQETHRIVDFPYAITPVTLFIVGDVTLAILVANLPIFYALLYRRITAKREKWARFAEIRKLRDAHTKHRQLYQSKDTTVVASEGS